MTSEEIAKLIRDQMITLNIGCGEDVNIHDAIASFRKDADVGPASELIADACAWAADDILAAIRKNSAEASVTVTGKDSKGGAA